jgi:hypothetical protein
MKLPIIVNYLRLYLVRIYVSMYTYIFICKINTQPIPVAARSKVRVYGRSFAGIVGSNSAYGMDVCVL